MKLLLSTFCLFVVTSLFAQVPNIDWVKQYGGNLGEFFRSVIKTEDGGYLMGGWSNSPVSGVKTDPVIGFNYDYWVVKIDGSGNIQWQKTIGGGKTWALGDETGEILDSIVEASDGSGYYLCGDSDSGVVGMKTEPSYGEYDYWIVKIDLNGNMLWQKALGGASTDRLFSATATVDGGCIVGGSSASGISGIKTESNRGNWDYWVIKLSTSGVLEWQKTFGGSSIDELYSIVPSADGYLLAGYSASPISGDKTESTKGYGDFWILKLSLSGELLWQKDIGGTGGDLLYTAVKTANGYLLGGESESNSGFDKTENSRGGSDYWMVAIDSNGTILWDKTFGGSDDDILLELAKISDTGYVLCGVSYSNISGDKTSNVYGDSDGWLIRTDSSGALLWQLGVGGIGEDGLNEVSTLIDGSILLGGVSWETSANSGNITTPNYGAYDYLLVKLEPESLANNDLDYDIFKIYPNPTSEKVYMSFENPVAEVTVEVYSQLSQKVMSMTFKNESAISIRLPEPNGIYFVNVKANSREWFKKIIKN